MISYLFCHGFGFNANYWQQFYPLLTKGESFFIDLGYFSAANYENIITKFNSHKIKIGIGHSLGFMKLIDFRVNFDVLIGINAFCNFLGESELYHSRKKELDILVKNFKINPKLTLKNFYQRCGINCSFNDFNLINNEILLEDLNFLLKKISLSSNVPTLIINTNDDAIIPPSITLDNFLSFTNVKIKFLIKGGHSIIINNPSKIANLINEFTKNYV